MSLPENWDKVWDIERQLDQMTSAKITRADNERARQLSRFEGIVTLGITGFLVIIAQVEPESTFGRVAPAQITLLLLTWITSVSAFGLVLLRYFLLAKGSTHLVNAHEVLLQANAFCLTTMSRERLGPIPDSEKIEMARAMRENSDSSRTQANDFEKKALSHNSTAFRLLIAASVCFASSILLYLAMRLTQML